MFWAIRVGQYMLGDGGKTTGRAIFDGPARDRVGKRYNS